MTKPPVAASQWLELRVLREKDGHSLRTLAAAADMAYGYLADLENGRREPNPRVTRKLAEALNVPISVLEKDRRPLGHECSCGSGAA
jgi:transcriptional regulator with XRE-family HTH domain